MKDVLRKSKRKVYERETAFLTKRTLIRATRLAGKKASKKAMEIVGYLITAEEGWVVQMNRDGSKEKLSKLTTEPKSTIIHLD